MVSRRRVACSNITSYIFRQSAGRTAKKSFLPKMGLVGSAKGVGPRKGRSSIENTLRPIMASSRFTPTRMNTPAWMPQSANRYVLP